MRFFKILLRRQRAMKVWTGDAKAEKKEHSSSNVKELPRENESPKKKEKENGSFRSHQM